MHLRGEQDDLFLPEKGQAHNRLVTFLAGNATNGNDLTLCLHLCPPNLMGSAITKQSRKIMVQLI